MCQRPVFMCDRLRVDVLDDVIAVARTGEPVAALARWGGTWGQRYAAVPGAIGFRVVVAGECWLRPEDGEPLRMAAGDVVLLPRAVPHALSDAPGTPVDGEACGPDSAGPFPAWDGPVTATLLCGAYRVDPARAHPLLAGLPAVVRPGRSPALSAVVDALAAEVAAPGAGGGTVLRALLDALLALALRGGTPSGTPTGWAAALADPAVRAALNAVHTAPGEGWTVASLAAVAGLSRAAFAERFRRLTGQAPLTYLTWWRMTLAERALRESGATLAAIAARVGYGSEFAFAAAFKREFGTPPGRYRARVAATG